MKLDDQVYLLGIRHHGPGCAYALMEALAEIKPDVVLMEGAAELADSWHLAGEADMKPPVAQLVYDPKNPSLASFYPWGEFSPEWHAMRFACAQNIPLEMIDLPAGIDFELREQPVEDVEAETDELESDEEAESDLTLTDSQDADIPTEETIEQLLANSAQPSPMDRVVHAAGYTDSETWWDIAIEHQRSGLEVFTGIAELMQTARQLEESENNDGLNLNAADSYEHHRDLLREAWMRKALRGARKKNQTIAVVCGAWHVPALAANVKVKDDNALLKGLTKRKVDVAWVPYTYQRFGFASGYRAGIDSPGWYDHLFRHHLSDSTVEDFSINWLIKVAHLLREEGFGCSSAHVIEAVRLANQLATLRGMNLPSLAETLEAAKAVMTEGNGAPLQVIKDKLIVSNRLGSLPKNIPQLPLEKDLDQQIKKLRLKKTPDDQYVSLDLRKDNGLNRSQLFHRLKLIDIPWGKKQRTSGTGTFKEEWVLNWQPEFAVALIDASTLGNTVGLAATRTINQQVQAIESISGLAGALEAIQLSDLQAAIPTTVSKLQSLAAVSGDIQDMLNGLLTLVQVARYGNVRQTSGESVNHIIDSMVIRITNGLASACVSLDQDAAYDMLTAMDKGHSAITLLEHPDYQQRWQQALLAVLNNDGCHPVLLGRCARILYDFEVFDAAELNRQFRLALSQGTDVMHGAAWFEGLLINGAVLLLYDGELFRMLDDWIVELDDDAFKRVLPLIRRSFASFNANELNQLGSRVKFGSADSVSVARATDERLEQLAQSQLAVLLGLSSEPLSN